MRSSRSSASSSGSANPVGARSPRRALRWLSRATIRRPIRIASLLVDGEVVGEPGDPGVHLGAAERLVVGLLAGGHLHQRRTAEEHLGALLDHDDVVAHARDVGAAGGRVAEHQRDRRPLVGARPG